MSCPLCTRVEELRERKNAHLIYEFKHSYLVLGDHQFFKAYCVLIFKRHERELHDLASLEQQQLFTELMQAGLAINQAYTPWKMNYSCYGNQVPHIHWHLFPRYEEDPDRLLHPWAHAEQFKHFVPSAQERAERVERIRSFLPNP